MLGTPKRFGTPADDAEIVVIDHPGPPPQAGSVNAPPPHFHDKRKVVCKQGTTELVMPPVGAFRQSVKYVRSEDKNVDGLAIFREAK
jgi:hypothetical protein